jgi:hypothetical protein
MTDRELIFETLNDLKGKSETLKWEVNFDDFEILSINFVYYDEGEDDDNGK